MLTFAAIVHESLRTRSGQTPCAGSESYRMRRAERRTEQEYSNPLGRERP